MSNIKIGDIVKFIDNTKKLWTGPSAKDYCKHAVVLSINPFKISSTDGLRTWSIDAYIEDFVKIGIADRDMLIRVFTGTKS